MPINNKSICSICKKEHKPYKPISKEEKDKMIKRANRVNEQHNKETWEERFEKELPTTTMVVKQIGKLYGVKLVTEEPVSLEHIDREKAKQFIKKEKQLSFEAGAKAERKENEELIDTIDLDLAMIQSTTEDTTHQQMVDMIGRIRNQIDKQLSHNKGEK